MKIFFQYRYGLLSAFVSVIAYAYVQHLYMMHLWVLMGIWGLLSSLIITLLAYAAYHWIRPERAALRHREFMKGAAALAIFIGVVLSYRALDPNMSLGLKFALLPAAMALSAIGLGAIITFDVYRFLILKPAIVKKSVIAASIILMAMILAGSVLSLYKFTCCPSGLWGSMTDSYMPSPQSRIFVSHGCNICEGLRFLSWF